MKTIAKKDIPEAIKHWEKMLTAYQEQASRIYIKETDYLPLWLGASNEQSAEWIKEELRLLKRKREGKRK